MTGKKSALLKSGEPLRALELRAEPGVDPGPALQVAFKKLLRDRDRGLRATRASYGEPEAAFARWQP